MSTADLSAENLTWLRAAYPHSRIVGVEKQQLLLQLEGQFSDEIADCAIHALARAHPSLSARSVPTIGQAGLAGLVIGATACAFTTGWHGALRDLAIWCAATFLAGTIFRGTLAWVGGGGSSTAAPQLAADDALPLYTILVPLYREANVVPRLIESLLALDYPKDKLDIKLIVECDDHETIEVIERLAHDRSFHVVRVPTGVPRTKPRACNYAFGFARGEFTVIYDAEDRPEPDQLRKAVAQFRRSARNIVCVQARLNFYNANENWLTRLFALDYALWFDVLLPGLEKLGMPIPLGGTSNHFRTSALQALGAWDPFNVTEDADLGIRMARMGMRVAMLDSTTFEEAPTHLRGWLKQRSRWLKGYMQTWLVHMREPGALLRDTGWRGFFALQLFLGGSVMSALANPLLWLIFLTSGSLLPATDHVATSLSVFGLVSGNLILTWLALIAPKRRGWKDMAPYGFTVAFYWALVSIAAWRGLWQLLTRPFHWDKTEHGLSRLETPR